LALPDPVPVVVEIDRRAESALDGRITRRLIALEIADIDVPARPTDGLRPTLFFRIVSDAGNRVVIELWERGVYYGRRNVAATGGSERVRARRVALAAAELARGLRRRRLAEGKKLRELEDQRLERERRARWTPPFARLALRAGATFGTVGAGDAWLMGPRLGAFVQFGNGLRLEAAASWLFGQALIADTGTKAEWLEVALRPSYALPLGRRFSIDAGLTLGAASVQLDELASVDEIAGQSSTWSARAAAELRFEAKLARQLRIGIGPTAGLLLRPIPVEATAGEPQRIEGAWLGGTVSVIFDPAAPPRPTSAAQQLLTPHSR
jgi:hypothetical protein